MTEPAHVAGYGLEARASAAASLGRATNSYVASHSFYLIACHIKLYLKALPEVSLIRPRINYHLFNIDVAVTANVSRI